MNPLRCPAPTLGRRSEDRLAAVELARGDGIVARDVSVFDRPAGLRDMLATLEVDVVVGYAAPTPDERSSAQGAADGQVGRCVVARIDDLNGRQGLCIGVEAVASRLQQRDGKTAPLAFERQGNAYRPPAPTMQTSAISRIPRPASSKIIARLVEFSGTLATAFAVNAAICADRPYVLGGSAGPRRRGRA